MRTKRHASIEMIHAELAWVNETPDPNKCGCRTVQCCEETGHSPGACAGSVVGKLWSFRWEYYCQACREYEWNGSRRRRYMPSARANSHCATNGRLEGSTE